MKEQVSVIGGVAVGATSWLVGGYDYLLSVFATIIIIDTLTGMLKAWNQGEYNSKLFRAGLVKKGGYIIGVMLVVQIDVLLKNSGFAVACRDATITLFTINEALSVLENLGGMGVEFPAFIQNSLKSLRSKTDTNDSTEEKK